MTREEVLAFRAEQRRKNEAFQKAWAKRERTRLRQWSVARRAQRWEWLFRRRADRMAAAAWPHRFQAYWGEAIPAWTYIKVCRRSAGVCERCGVSILGEPGGPKLGVLHHTDYPRRWHNHPRVETPLDLRLWCHSCHDSWHGES